MAVPYIETLHRVYPDAGAPVPVRRLQSSPRSEVWLVEFGGSPAIVKRHTTASDGFAREVAALRRAGSVRPSPVAELLAADPQERLLMLEYVSGTPAKASTWSVDYATALARLHTAGGEGLPAWSGPGPADVERFLALAGRLGVTVTPAAARQLHAATERPGDDALLHGDPCPDNAVGSGDGIRFVDLEQACHGPGVVELAYLRIGFPTCWCVAALAPGQVEQAEAAYREIRPAVDVAAACAGWLLRGDALVDRARRDGTDHLARAADEDWEWGTATARERLLHRLGVVAAVAVDLPEVAALASTMRAAASRSWPGLSPVPVVAGDPVDG